MCSHFCPNSWDPDVSQCRLPWKCTCAHISERDGGVGSWKKKWNLNAPCTREYVQRYLYDHSNKDSYDRIGVDGKTWLTRSFANIPKFVSTE